jgi:hypothetical protein
MPGLHIPKLPSGSVMGDPGSSWRDKLMMLSLAFNTDPQVRAQLPLLMMQQKQRAAQGAAETDLANFASGRAIPQRPEALDLGTDQPHAPPQAPVAPRPDQPMDVPMLGNLGGSPPMLKPMAAPQIPMRDPRADAMGRPASVRNALPLLARLAQTGGDPTKWQAMLKDAEPDIAFAPNDEAVDKHDPNSVGKTYAKTEYINGHRVAPNSPDAPAFLPKIADGAVPLYDEHGSVVAQKLLDGTIQAVEQAAQADQTGKTMGTVFNNPNGDGSTTPTLGADMFGKGGAAGGRIGGDGAAGGAGRTLTPGQTKAQEADYTAGAGVVAGAGDAKIKAATTAQQYTQALNDVLSLNPNDLTGFKLGTAKILRSIGVNNPNLEQFTNTAEGYRMLTTQMVLPLAKELGSNPSNRDAKIIQDSMPSLRTPRQTAAVSFAQAAATHAKEAARQNFYANWTGDQSKAAMQRAWSASPEAKRSIFQDPVFQSLQLDGHPAVVFKEAGGKRYGVFHPYNADGSINQHAQVFEAF